MIKRVVFIFSVCIVSYSYAETQKPYIDTHVHLSKTYSKAAMRVKQLMKHRRIRKARGLPVKPLPKSFQRVHSQANYESSARNLIQKMDSARVGKAIIVTVPEGKNKHFNYDPLFNTVKRFPGRLYVAAGGATLGPMLLRAADRHVSHQMKTQFLKEAEHLIDKGAVAFGEMILFHFCLDPRHSYQSVNISGPLMTSLADLAARRNIPIDVHLESVAKSMDTPQNLRAACRKNPPTIPATIPAFERLLKHNRKAIFVWQHVGWDNLGQTTTSLLRRLLTAHPNLYLSIRIEDRFNQVKSTERMPNRIIDRHGKIKKAWLTLFKQFKDRIMVGSDEFIPPLDSRHRFPRSFSSTWKVLEQMPYSLSDRIGYLNAKKVYHL